VSGIEHVENQTVTLFAQFNLYRHLAMLARVGNEFSEDHHRRFDIGFAVAGVTQRLRECVAGARDVFAVGMGDAEVP